MTGKQDLMNQVPLLTDKVWNILPYLISIPYRPIIKDFNLKFFGFGSCFALEVMQPLSKLGFNAHYDEKVSYHFTTKTLLELLRVFREGRPFTEDEIYFNPNEQKHMSFLHHMFITYGEKDKSKLLSQMNLEAEKTKAKLKSTDVIILTLGNATWLEHKETGKSICHTGYTINGGDCEIRRSSVDEITQELQEIYEILKELIDDDFYFIVTISPQRYAWHLPKSSHKYFNSYNEIDSLVGSNCDKAKLRVAIDRFMNKHEKDNVEYFPSYDIVMDELRMVEGFKDDFNDHLHVTQPRTPAYVVNRFLMSHCSETMIELLQFYRSNYRRWLPKSANVFYGYEDELNKTVSKLGYYLKETNCRKIVDEFLFGAESSVSSEQVVKYRKLFALEENDNNETYVDFVCRNNDLIKELEAENKKILVFGCGKHTDFLMKYTLLSKLDIVAFADDNYNSIKNIYNIPVINPMEIMDTQSDLILISSTAFQEKMRQKAEDIADGKIPVMSFYSEDELEIVSQYISIYR
jgi:hypothetical protein